MTAVELMIEEVEELITIETFPKWERIKKRAKVIEKQQMWEYIKKNYCIGDKSLEFHRLEFEKYFNETYRSGEVKTH